MKNFLRLPSRFRLSIRVALAFATLLVVPARAETPKSLLPIFGNEGAEFTNCLAE